MLGRRAKLQWGLGRKALKVIYDGAIAPILTYGAPICVEAIRKSKVKAGVQPIQLTTYEKLPSYMTTKINNIEDDATLEVRYWRHPAEIATPNELEYITMCTTEVYTDRSKIGDKVWAAGIIFLNGKLVHKIKFKLHGHCCNNQAEQIAILNFRSQAFAVS